MTLETKKQSKVKKSKSTQSLFILGFIVQLALDILYAFQSVRILKLNSANLYFLDGWNCIDDKVFHCLLFVMLMIFMLMLILRDIIFIIHLIDFFVNIEALIFAKINLKLDIVQGDFSILFEHHLHDLLEFLDNCLFDILCWKLFFWRAFNLLALFLFGLRSFYYNRLGAAWKIFVCWCYCRYFAWFAANWLWLYFLFD